MWTVNLAVDEMKLELQVQESFNIKSFSCSRAARADSLNSLKKSLEMKMQAYSPRERLENNTGFKEASTATCKLTKCV